MSFSGATLFRAQMSFRADMHEHPQWEIWVSEYLGALGCHFDRRAFLKSLYEMGVMVDEVDHDTAMQACRICGGKPFVGTIIARLRCAHLFHYHCIVWHLKDHCACPIPTCAPPPSTLSQTTLLAFALTVAL
ncbi:hypothetical protein OROGR_015996 [Orobanche gracilis]